MKNSLKRKLSLFLAIVLAFTMTLPAGILSSAAAGPLTALEEDVTDKVNASTIQATAQGFNNEGPDKLFDSDSSTKYCANTSFPMSITWQMTEAVALQTYAFTTGADSGNFAGRDLQSWVLYGSTDGATWSIIDVRAGQTGNQNSLTQTYTVANTHAYTYYKLLVASNTSSNEAKIVQLADMQLSTKLNDSDSDTAEGKAAADASKLAASDFDAKLTAMGVINDDTYNENTTVALVDSLANEYKGLDPLAKALLNKYNLLVIAQEYISKLSAVPRLNSLIQLIVKEIDEIYDDGNGTLDFDYHINGDITYAYDVYKSLSAEDKLKIKDIDKLANCREIMDEYHNKDFKVYVDGWNQVEKATKTPWLATADDAQQALTWENAADELKYQLARQGYMLGNYGGKTVPLTAEWGSSMIAQIESTPNDNLGNPWNQANRMWSALTIPFAGTAFSSTGFMSLSDTVPAISNAFYYNGKVYQQFMGTLKSYDYMEISVDNKSLVSVKSTVSYPGYDGTTDATNNTFNLAYAKYNQAKKWDGVVVGIAAGTVATTDTAIYQQFEGPDGVAYIVAAKSKVAATDKNAPQDGTAFVLTGAVVNAIIAKGTDFASGLAVTGAPIGEMSSEGAQLFENGIIDKGVFSVYGPENAYLLVINQIADLPTTITAENYETAKTAITAARTAYDALTANQNKVTNYDELVAAETLLQAFEVDVNAAKAFDDKVDASFPEGKDTVVYEDKAMIEGLRADYEKLTPTQKSLVKNYFILTWAENELSVVLVEHFEGTVRALPADEHIDGENLAADTALSNAAKAEYDALTADQKNSVDADLVSALNQKLDIVAAGGYTKWMEQQSILGDVDGDKSVNVSDVVKLRAIIMKGSSTDKELRAGDMDKNKSLDVSDVVALRSYIMKGGAK